MLYIKERFNGEPNLGRTGLSQGLSWRHDRGHSDHQSYDELLSEHVSSGTENNERRTIRRGIPLQTLHSGEQCTVPSGISSLCDALAVLKAIPQRELLHARRREHPAVPAK